MKKVLFYAFKLAAISSFITWFVSVIHDDMPRATAFIALAIACDIKAHLLKQPNEK